MQAAQLDSCTRDVAGLAEALLDGGPVDEEACARLLLAVEARVQAEAALGRPAGAPLPACARGCAACCTVNVGTTGLEGAAAAAFLRRRLPPAAASALAAELLRSHDRVRWLDDGERVRAGARCPLLDARGGCTIHPARPLACRALTSLDAGECRRALEDRAEEDGPGLVRQDLLQKALYDGAAAALHEVLARRGLDARHRDVSGMTGFFLADAARAAAFSTGARLALD